MGVEADKLHLLEGSFIEPPPPQGHSRGPRAGCPHTHLSVCTCTCTVQADAALGPVLTANGAASGLHRTRGTAGGGTGMGRWGQVSGLPRHCSSPDPCRGGRVAPKGCPKNISYFRSPRYSVCPREGWERGRGWETGTGGARSPAPLARPRALTVGAIALPRAGHLLRAEAALRCHREVAQHVGGREQVRCLHAARPAV